MSASLTKAQSNSLKGIAILLMIFLHLFPNEEIIEQCQNFLYLGHHAFAYYFRKIATMVVPLYLFLGGYGLYATYCHREGKMQNGRRVTLLFVHYWLIFIVFVPIGCYFNSEIYIGSVQKLGANFLGIAYSYNYEWWFFLPYAMLTAVSQPLIKKLQTTSRHTDAMLLLLSFGLLVVPTSTIKTLGGMYGGLLDCLVHFALNLSQLLFAFLCGLFFGKYRVPLRVAYLIRRRKWRERRMELFIILLLVLRMSIGSSALFNPFFIVLLIAMFGQATLPSIGIRILGLFGAHSTNIWLFHTFFIKYYWGRELLLSLRYPALIFLATALLCLVVSYLLNFFVLPVKRYVGSLWMEKI